MTLLNSTINAKYPQQAFTSVAQSSDGSNVIACSGNGICISSDSGATYTVVATGNFQSVAISGDGTLAYAGVVYKEEKVENIRFKI